MLSSSLLHDENSPRNAIIPNSVNKFLIIRIVMSMYANLIPFCGFCTITGKYLVTINSLCVWDILLLCNMEFQNDKILYIGDNKFSLCFDAQIIFV